MKRRIDFQLVGLFLLCISIFSILALTYSSPPIVKFDAIVSNYILSLRNDTLTNWFIFLSYIGSIKIYVLVSLLLAGYFLIRRRFWIAALLVVMLQGSHYINAILKIWYERQRPDIKTLVTATGYSFPSGHAMNAMSFLSFIAYVTITEHRLTLWQKIIVIFFTIFLILFIGISRIYLGVHYPSDVVAGFAAGGSWVVLCILFHRYFRTTAK